MGFEREPTISVTLRQTVNLGDYNSASVEVSVYSLPIDAPDELIDELVGTGGRAFKSAARLLGEKVRAIRRDNGIE